jgi:hypothetical protein
MVAENIVVKSVRQIIPTSGLWLRYDESREGIGESFLPVVAIAHCEIEPPNPVYFTDSFYMPITSGELMYGLLEHKPFEGVRFTYSIYHDVDFEEVGFRLKSGARPRSVVGLPEER